MACHARRVNFLTNLAPIAYRNILSCMHIINSLSVIIIIIIIIIMSPSFLLGTQVVYKSFPLLSTGC